MSENKNISLSTSVKISWIQFICSLIVITDHSFDYLGFGNSQMNSLSSIIYFVTQMLTSSFTSIAMPTFFVLSGFLMFKDWNSRKSTSDWYLGKIRSRIKSLVVPYFLWNLIWTIAFIAMGIFGKIDNNIDTSITLANIFRGIVLAKYNEVFWFMQVLILYVVLSPLIGYILNSRIGMICLFFLSLLAANVIPIGNVLGRFIIIQTYYNLFFYCLGAYLSINKSDYINKCYSKWHSLISVGVITIVLALIRCSKGMHVLRLPNYIVMVICLIGVYSFWIVVDFVRNCKVYYFVKYSFMNYALHKPVQQFYNKIVAMLFKPTLAGYLVNLLGGGIITVGFIIVFVKIASKLTPRLLEILNGGRKISA